MRNCHSTTAGKPSGTSFSGGIARPRGHDCNDEDRDPDQRRVPSPELLDEAIPDIPRDDHRGQRQQNHPKIDRGPQADRVGVADRGRVRRIFEDRDGVNGDEAAERDQSRRQARAEIAHPAVENCESEREQTAERDVVDGDASEKANAGLDWSTDKSPSSGSGGGGVSPFATAASCSALAFASSIALSNAIARSTAGSPTTFNKPNESRAATKPTIIPRHNKDPVVIFLILNRSRP